MFDDGSLNENSSDVFTVNQFANNDTINIYNNESYGNTPFIRCGSICVYKYITKNKY